MWLVHKDPARIPGPPSGTGTPYLPIEIEDIPQLGRPASPRLEPCHAVSEQRLVSCDPSELRIRLVHRRRLQSTGGLTILCKRVRPARRVTYSMIRSRRTDDDRCSGTRLSDH